MIGTCYTAIDARYKRPYNKSLCVYARTHLFVILYASCIRVMLVSLPQSTVMAIVQFDGRWYSIINVRISYDSRIASGYLRLPLSAWMLTQSS